MPNPTWKNPRFHWNSVEGVAADFLELRRGMKYDRDM
jgi:hypothetical protein